MRYSNSCNSRAAYFQTRSHTPQVAAIIRANQAKSNNNNPVTHTQQTEHEDTLPLTRFFYAETVGSKHPDLALMLATPSQKDTYVHSTRQAKWECPQGHKWSMQIDNMIALHEHAKTQGKPSCYKCAETQTSEQTVNPHGWSLQTKHPDLAAMFKNKNRNHTSLTSIAKARWQCSNNHQWSEQIKTIVTRHEQAVQNNKPTCPVCAEWETPKTKPQRPTRQGINTDSQPRNFYIHKITKQEQTLGYKYGIATNVEKRRTQQQRKAQTGITLTTVYTIKATSLQVQTLETKLTRTLKQANHTQALTKQQLPDGYTETTTHTIEQLTNIIETIQQDTYPLT